jgi:hypothetical protein
LFVEAVPSSISELNKLEVLNLMQTGITGTLDFDHHPMMISVMTFVFVCVAVINGIEGCINLKELNLNGCRSLTGLFSGHHPVMIADSCCALQTSTESKDASIWRNCSSMAAVH